MPDGISFGGLENLPPAVIVSAELRDRSGYGGHDAIGTGCSPTAAWRHMLVLGSGRPGFRCFGMSKERGHVGRSGNGGELSRAGIGFR